MENESDKSIEISDDEYDLSQALLEQATIKKAKIVKNRKRIADFEARELTLIKRTKDLEDALDNSSRKFEALEAKHLVKETPKEPEVVQNIPVETITVHLPPDRPKPTVNLNKYRKIIIRG